MTLRDCYRLTLHTIKENKPRSILTIIISTFLSALIMGMMSLAVSFFKNSNEIINRAYFSNDNSVVTVNYNNKKQLDVEEHNVFYKEYFDQFIDTVNKYSDMVQFIEYKTNLSAPMEFTEPDYPKNAGINIIEGRYISKSEARNEVIVSKEYYEKTLQDDNVQNIHSVGSEHIFLAPFPVSSSRGRENYDYVVLTYKVVGIFEYKTPQKLVVNGVEQYLTYGSMLGDIGIAFNNGDPRVYISAFTLNHYPQKAVTNPAQTITKLNSLKTDLNAFLPQALTIEYFNFGGTTDRIDHYSDGATCNVYEKYEENNAIRYLVLAGALFFSIVLILMSIGSLANSVIISIDGSKKFIGLLKALGMRGKSLKMIVVMESITLISIGVLLGYLVLFALYVPLTSLINAIIGFAFNAYIKAAAYKSVIYIPVYIFFGALLVFLLFTYLFSRGSLHKIAKTDPIAVINEVS